MVLVILFVVLVVLEVVLVVLEVILLFLGVVLVVQEVTGPQVAPTQVDPTVPSLIFLRKIMFWANYNWAILGNNDSF